MNKLQQYYSWLTHPYALIGVGWFMVIGSLIAWPITALTVFKDEQQGILGLSWFALIFAGYSVVAAGHADLSARRDKSL